MTIIIKTAQTLPILMSCYRAHPFPPSYDNHALNRSITLIAF